MLALGLSSNMNDSASHAVRHCPFLRELAREQGEAYARQVAINPVLPVDLGARRPVLEEEEDFQSTFRLFHGVEGLFPLVKPTSQTSVEPVHDLMASKAPPVTEHTRPAARPQAVPLASMSMSFFGPGPDFSHLFNQLNHKKKLRKQKEQEHRRPRASSGASSVQQRAPSGGTVEGGCPLRKWLGPAAGLVFNSKGILTCPEPIVKMRAMLAKTQAVKALRPRSLTTKVLAVGATSAALNIPCGAWREHQEKFSLEWFVAVHATIPFIAALRKAVVMPPYAMVFTIAAAVAGQFIGARLERERMKRVTAPAGAGLLVPAETRGRDVGMLRESEEVGSWPSTCRDARGGGSLASHMHGNAWSVTC